MWLFTFYITYSLGKNMNLWVKSKTDQTLEAFGMATSQRVKALNSNQL